MPLRVLKDTRGTTVIEFGLTAPIFFMMVMGIILFGMAVWVQVGLQHGAEMAARCATVDKTICGNSAAIQTYAAQKTFGVNPPPSTFSFTNSACGNEVTASYTFNFLTSYFPTSFVTLTAGSCFPS
jgi:hypothetical protein